MCSCRKGYEIDDEDEKNCVDVDECVDDDGDNNNGRFVVNGNISLRMYILVLRTIIIITQHILCCYFSVHYSNMISIHSFLLFPPPPPHIIHIFHKHV